MNKITLTINGKQVDGREGDTILDVCQANGIDIPTLCHYQGLTDVAACRLCLVEVEKERRPVPACTYPARNGLVVQTHTSNMERYRRLILELFFTERNHLCAYCVASGDCELQNLAYRYQMDNFRYPLSWPALPVDSVNDYVVIDHNRCVLCGRCIRACDQFAGVHTLDFGYRGWKEMVCADLNKPLGESSCISCGACFQACPTGAVFSKASIYRGRPSECDQATSVCPFCGVGCEINVLVKDDKLVRIDSPDLGNDRGLLCYMGRFAPLYQERERISTPLVRNAKGKLEPCSLDEAMDKISEKFTELKARYGKDSIAGIASSLACNESLKAFKQFMTEAIGTKSLDTIDGDDYRVVIQGIRNFEDHSNLDIEASLEDILKADCVILAGANPLETNPVVGSYILRAVRRNKADLILLDSLSNTLSHHAFTWLKPKEGKEGAAVNALVKAAISKAPPKNSAKANSSSMLKDIDDIRASKEAGININDINKAAEVIAKAKYGIVIYGNGILKHREPKLITALIHLAAICSNNDKGKPRTICLKPKGNSRGAWDTGVANPTESIIGKLHNNGMKGLYLLLADDYVDTPGLAEIMKKMEFAVVQSSYASPITNMASVVLPGPTWAETGASYTTIDGLVKSASRLVRPPDGVRSNWKTIQEISSRLKK